MEYNITYRKKDGGIQYIISYKNHEGKWEQKSKQGFKSKKIAKEAADKRLDELKEAWDLAPDPEYGEITFGEFAKLCSGSMEIHNEYNTLAQREVALKKFSALDRMKVTTINPLHIQNCVDEMAKEKLEPSTIRQYLTNCQSVFISAVRYKIIRSSPVEGIRIVENKKPPGIKALSKAQRDKLLSSITNINYYTISVIATKCGLRIGEIMGLLWDNIDFDKGLIHVNIQWKLLEKKKYGFGALKSSKAYRTLPAPPSVLKALKIYKKKTPANIDKRVFSYKNTSGVSFALKNHYKKSGFDITVHDLRHTFATMLLAENVDYKTVADLMGHDVKETIRTYSHVTEDMMARAADAIIGLD